MLSPDVKEEQTYWQKMHLRAPVEVRRAVVKQFPGATVASHAPGSHPNYQNKGTPYGGVFVRVRLSDGQVEEHAFRRNSDDSYTWDPRVTDRIRR